ncbi:MAG: hypothetical protein WBD01_07275 [Salaquimonas sp.]
MTSQSKAILSVGLLLLTLVLAGCNSGSLSDGLESAATPQPSQSLEGAATTTAQNQTNLDSTANPSTGEQIASLPVGKAVAFLPVSNAPQSAVTNLAKSIRNAASASGVPVVASVQQGAEYQVKGYFSALEDGSGTLLVYVWDVLDKNNKRVYRINGQEQTSSRSSDPWASVSVTMIDRVALTTVAQLKSWLNTR